MYLKTVCRRVVLVNYLAIFNYVFKLPLPAITSIYLVLRVGHFISPKAKTHNHKGLITQQVQFYQHVLSTKQLFIAMYFPIYKIPFLKPSLFVLRSYNCFNIKIVILVYIFTSRYCLA